MALDQSRKEELRQLLTFRDLISADKRVPFTIEIEKEALDYSRLLVRFVGLKTLVVDGPGHRTHTGPITALVTIPPGHAALNRVSISFRDPVPFHPHVFTSGSICWGSVAQSDAGSWTLVLWTLALLEYLMMNQKSFIGINPSSPANRNALNWWSSNKNRLASEITQVDLNYVRQLSQKARGLA